MGAWSLGIYVDSPQSPEWSPPTEPYSQPAHYGMSNLDPFSKPWECLGFFLLTVMGYQGNMWEHCWEFLVARCPVILWTISPVTGIADTPVIIMTRSGLTAPLRLWRCNLLTGRRWPRSVVVWFSPCMSHLGIGQQGKASKSGRCRSVCFERVSVSMFCEPRMYSC